MGNFSTITKPLKYSQDSTLIFSYLPYIQMKQIRDREQGRRALTKIPLYNPPSVGWGVTHGKVLIQRAAPSV